jgi:pyruvate formate lyase activating enzyme
MGTKIAGFIKTSLLDWDGHVVSSIYLPGCNFRCPFCHNRDLVLEPDSLPEIPFSEVEDYVKENLEFLDGVVITGGEPTIHSDLPDLVRRVKALGVKVKLDTNGTSPDMIKDLIDAGLIDYVAMDLKAPLNDKYDDLAGVKAPLDSIKRTIGILETSGIDHEYRTTVVPILLTPSDVEAMAAYIGGAKKYALQQFRPGNTLDPNLSAIRPYPPGTILGMAENAKQYVRKVVIRGD